MRHVVCISVFLVWPICVALCDDSVVTSSVVTSDDLEHLSRSLLHREKACGPICLAYCIGRLSGDRILPSSISGEATWQEEGVAISELLRLARVHGLNPTLIRDPRRNLRSLRAGSILIIRGDHCVVFEGLEDNSVAIFDPVRNKVSSHPVETLMVQWNGEAIVFYDLPPPMHRQIMPALAVGGLVFAGLILLRRTLQFRRRRTGS